MSDEKLNECSAEATGVYIRLMCIMHKNEEYGVVRLKAKDKHSGRPVTDLARKLARQMPYDAKTIERGLDELLEEGVLNLDGDMLYQKRMCMTAASAVFALPQADSGGTGPLTICTACCR